MQTALETVIAVLSRLEPRKVTLIVNEGGKEREVELSSNAYGRKVS